MPQILGPQNVAPSSIQFTDRACYTAGLKLKLLDLSHAHAIIGLGLLASIGGIVSACTSVWQLAYGMQRTLQFILRSHQVPFVFGRFALNQHVAKADRVCKHYSYVAVMYKLHMMFECPALHALRQQHAPVFATHTTA